MCATVEGLDHVEGRGVRDDARELELLAVEVAHREAERVQPPHREADHRQWPELALIKMRAANTTRINPCMRIGMPATRPMVKQKRFMTGRIRGAAVP